VKEVRTQAFLRQVTLSVIVEPGHQPDAIMQLMNMYIQLEGSFETEDGSYSVSNESEPGVISSHLEEARMSLGLSIPAQSFPASVTIEGLSECSHHRLG
jgi:hypothetical protein